MNKISGINLADNSFGAFRIIRNKQKQSPSMQAGSFDPTISINETTNLKYLALGNISRLPS